MDRGSAAGAVNEAGIDMSWLWFAVVGGFFAPWFIFPGSIPAAFGRGPLVGFGYWIGMAMVTTPMIVLLFWLAHSLGIID